MSAIEVISVPNGQALAPLGGDRLDSEVGAGDLAEDRSGGVGVVTEIDHLEGALPEVLGVEEGPQHRLQGVHHVAGASDIRGAA